MTTASISEIKQELSSLSVSELLALCVRLSKYKKENKELLNYLLFQSNDEQAFVEMVKDLITDEFETVNKSNLYFAKKTIRKILRIANKHIKHTASKEVEVQVLMHFCATMELSGIPFRKNTALSNLYQSQLKKIEKVISAMHEDLQYDYLKDLEKMR
jgi:viroplasmin and RNaseH domain-containing protein